MSFNRNKSEHTEYFLFFISSTGRYIQMYALDDDKLLYSLTHVNILMHFYSIIYINTVLLLSLFDKINSKNEIKMLL